MQRKLLTDLDLFSAKARQYSSLSRYGEPGMHYDRFTILQSPLTELSNPLSSAFPLS